MHSKTLNEVQQISFLYEGNTIPRIHPQHQGHLTITFKNSSHPEQNMHPPKMPKQFMPSLV